MKQIDKITELIQREVDKLGYMPTMDELNRIAQKVMERENKSPLPDAEGLSPDDLSRLLYKLFEEDCPVRLNQKIPDQTAGLSPMVRLSQSLMTVLQENQSLKLTATGALPVKVVQELYDKKFIPVEHIEWGIVKIRTERDCAPVHLGVILCKLTGLVKVRKGKLSLTAKGGKMLHSPSGLLVELFTAFCTRFNWGYFDRYASPHTAQMGSGFTLLLLHRYGKTGKKADFYSSRYLRAFPMILNEYSNTSFIRPEVEFFRCYQLRSFQRGFNWFGLTDVSQEPRRYRMEFIADVKASPLLYELILIRPKA
jgi:hypothetical protein